jgi:hypothetical protein
LDNHEERKSAQQSKKSAEQPGNLDVFTVLRALRFFVVHNLDPSFGWVGCEKSGAQRQAERRSFTPPV